jgi:tetraacyldisaccharide 4'-kinase
VPHLQHPDRITSARRAVRENNAQLLVLDDGFQHRRLARDLDIVLIDALNPWGYGHLLPRGLLREPLASLRRAHLIAITRADQCPAGERARIRAAIAETGAAAPVIEIAYPPVRLINAAGETAPLPMLAGRAVAAFCGIGNPPAFRESLLGLGARVTAFSGFPDHHHYTAADLDAIGRAVVGADVVVTTQKDLVKLERTNLAGRPLWAVQIDVQVLDGVDVLRQTLEQIVHAAGNSEQPPPSRGGFSPAIGM